MGLHISAERSALRDYLQRADHHRPDSSGAQRGQYREVPAGKLLSHNLLLYGLGGLAAPFLFIKLIDMLLVLLGAA